MINYPPIDELAEKQVQNMRFALWQARERGNLSTMLTIRV